MGRFWRSIYIFLAPQGPRQANRTPTYPQAPLSSSDLKLVGQTASWGPSEVKNSQNEAEMGQMGRFWPSIYRYLAPQGPRQANVTPTHPPEHPYLPTTSNSWPKRPCRGRARSKTLKMRPKWARWADFGDLFIDFWPHRGPVKPM